MRRALAYAWLLVFVAWLVFTFSMLSAQSRGTYVAAVKVRELPTGRTLGEMPTFYLTTGGVTVTVMGDPQVPLIRYLREVDGETVQLSLTPARLTR